MIRILALVTAAAALLLQPATATAMEGGAAGTKPRCQTGYAWNPAKKRCLPLCKKGMVYNAQQNKCLKHRTGAASDLELKAQGWALARAGRFEEAIALFGLLADPSDAEALNGLGYVNRKLGHLDVAIGYYKQALARDPGYVLAREYLGEGYVAAGRIDLAKAELDAIGRSCGTLCESYLELHAAIHAASVLR